MVPWNQRTLQKRFYRTPQKRFYRTLYRTPFWPPKRFYRTPVKGFSRTTEKVLSNLSHRTTPFSGYPFRISLLDVFCKKMYASLGSGALSAKYAAGPNILDYFLFPWAWHWNRQKPPLPSLVPEFRKIGKRYVKAVLAVLGANWWRSFEFFGRWKLQWSFGGKFSSKNERPPGQKIIGPWSEYQSTVCILGAL